jgi:hypothetical protein
MVLVGCAQGQQCATIATLPVAYRDETGCLAARSEMVAASSDLGFERVFAECRKQARAGSRQASVRAEPTT